MDNSKLPDYFGRGEAGRPKCRAVECLSLPFVTKGEPQRSLACSRRLGSLLVSVCTFSNAQFRRLVGRRSHENNSRTIPERLILTTVDTHIREVRLQLFHTAISSLSDVPNTDLT